jgi:hypothetical protein
MVYESLSGSASTSMYSSETRPSTAGNAVSHLTQPNLLLCRAAPGITLVGTMYFAPQLGQANANGPDLLGPERAGICS